MKTNRFLLFAIPTLLVSCVTESSEENVTSVDSTEVAYVKYDEQFPELKSKAKKFFEPLPEVMVSENYEITDEKVALGKKLYYDVRLSKDNTQSCNTCHNLNTYGVDNNPTSTGNDGMNGDRNSPTVLNAAIHFVQFWDGRAADVEEQAGGPIVNPVEMAMPHDLAVVKRLAKMPEYQELFAEAFPGESVPLNMENLKIAVGAFERTLVTPAPFDEYLKGNVMALNEQQKRGLQTFMDVGCTTCHSGAALGGNMYQKFGLYDDYWKHTSSTHVDQGVFTISGTESDMYKFKVPSLRNITKTQPYFHDGSVTDLHQAVNIMAKLQLNKELTAQETDDIVAFLDALTGKVPEECLQK